MLGRGANTSPRLMRRSWSTLREPYSVVALLPSGTDGGASARWHADAAEGRRGPGRRAAPCPARARGGAWAAGGSERGAGRGGRRGRRTAETSARRRRIWKGRGRRAEVDNLWAEPDSGRVEIGSVRIKISHPFPAHGLVRARYLIRAWTASGPWDWFPLPSPVLQ